MTEYPAGTEQRHIASTTIAHTGAQDFINSNAIVQSSVYSVCFAKSRIAYLAARAASKLHISHQW